MMHVQPVAPVQTATPAQEMLHISSLVVHVRPDLLSQTAEAVCALRGTEVHGAEGGKMVVTLETQTEQEIIERMGEISALNGVMSVLMVYHQVEPAEDLALPL